jgi:hypothetical protein
LIKIKAENKNIAGKRGEPKRKPKRCHACKQYKSLDSIKENVFVLCSRNFARKIYCLKSKKPEKSVET